MVDLHNCAATYEGGYAISTGALHEFIKQIDAIILDDSAPTNHKVDLVKLKKFVFVI